MACRRCISNRSWRARPLRATGSPRTCATCPPMSAIAPPSSPPSWSPMRCCTPRPRCASPSTSCPDRIRVDVADGNPAFPSVKEYGRDAATGRGLTLFDTLASNWGVQAVDGGKIVWFELPVDFPVAPVSVSDGTFRFDLTGIARAERHGDLDQSPDVSVRLIGIPVTLLQKSSEEYEALFRELRLMKERADSSSGATALARAPLRARVGDRHPLRRAGARHGRDVADGRRQQDRRPSTGPSSCPSPPWWPASSTTPCSTRPTSSGSRSGS